MSSLFDFALTNAASSSAVDKEIEALARTILLMTDDDCYENDEYFRAADGMFINWELLIREGLIKLLLAEATKSKDADRPASLGNTITMLASENEVEQTLSMLDLWRVTLPEQKAYFCSELLERLSVICSMPDLADLTHSSGSISGSPDQQPRIEREITKPYVLEIPQPSPYFSLDDERHFFEWLQSIKPIRKVTGYSGGLILELESPILDDRSLRELIALMTRYNLDMSDLRSQCTSENRSWFENEEAYWYERIFISD